LAKIPASAVAISTLTVVSRLSRNVGITREIASGEGMPSGVDDELGCPIGDERPALIEVGEVAELDPGR
jgi:hypothetical protein